MITISIFYFGAWLIGAALVGCAVTLVVMFSAKDD